VLRYNNTEHPIPFHKATDLGKVPKKFAGGPAPDLEDIFDVSISWMSIAPHQHLHLFQLDDEVVDVSDDEKKNVKDEDEVAADKLIQASKPRFQKVKTTTIKGRKAQNFM